jgi:hypothetical protein
MNQTKIPKPYKTIFSIPFEALSGPITSSLQLYLMSGSSANGSKKLKEAFTMLTMVFKYAGNKTLTMTHGVMAISRVTIARTLVGNRIFKNPSMIYCPVYVVVMALFNG